MGMNLNIVNSLHVPEDRDSILIWYPKLQEAHWDTGIEE